MVSKKLFINLTLISCAISVSPSFLRADEESFLTLNEAVRAAMANNYGILIAGAEPEIARAVVESNDAQFDFEFFGSAQLAQSDQSTTFSQTTGTSSDNRNYTIGARKRFAPGTIVTAQTNLNRRFSNAGVNTSNLSQEADFALSIRQPLLDGFGSSANMTNLNKARAALSGSIAEFRSQVLSTLSETVQNYWTVSRLQTTVLLRESSLKVAEELLNEAIEKERVGKATRLDILQARASRAEAIENIIDAKRDLHNATDLLFATTGRLDTSAEFAYETNVLPLQRPERDLDEFNDYWRSALSHEPTLVAQEAIIQQREYDRISARNSTRPTLDLVMTGAYVGLDDNSAETAYDRALDRAGNQWSVGVEFSFPWANREAEAAVISANKRIEQAEWRLLELKQNLFRSVRTAYRDISTEIERLGATSLSVELQEATFAQEKEKYSTGISAFRDVLQAQRNLDQARIRQLQAQANLVLAFLRMDELTGRLLDEFGIDAPKDTQN